MGSNPTVMVSLQEECIWTEMHAERSCEDTGRRQPPRGSGKRLQKKPSLPAPCSQTPNLQNCEKTSFCCLSHSVCGTVLRYGGPSKTTVGFQVCAERFVFPMRHIQVRLNRVPHQRGNPQCSFPDSISFIAPRNKCSEIQGYGHCSVGGS